MSPAITAESLAVGPYRAKSIFPSLSTAQDSAKIWALRRDGMKVALTHDKIGQIIGRSRETVTRTLADFRQQNIAVLHGSTLLIQNLPALQQLAN